MAKFVTFFRHELQVIGVLGNEAKWTQISLEQVVLLWDDKGCRLNQSAYHEVVKGFGTEGLLI